MAAPLQTTYTERMPVGSAGMPASAYKQDVDTKIVENSNGIPFGRAVGKGSTDRGVRLGSSAANQFEGISVRDTTLAPVTLDSDYTDIYEKGANCGVMNRGDIWVAVGAAVVAGQDVSFDATTGILSTAGAGGSQFTIAGARWMTSQSTTGGLAIVRLTGSLPGA